MQAAAGSVSGSQLEGVWTLPSSGAASAHAAYGNYIIAQTMSAEAARIKNYQGVLSSPFLCQPYGSLCGTAHTPLQAPIALYECNMRLHCLRMPFCNSTEHHDYIRRVDTHCKSALKDVTCSKGQM